MAKRIWALMVGCMLLLSSIGTATAAVYADPAIAARAEIPMVATETDDPAIDPETGEETDPPKPEPEPEIPTDPEGNTDSEGPTDHEGEPDPKPERPSKPSKPSKPAGETKPKPVKPSKPNNEKDPAGEVPQETEGGDNSGEESYEEPASAVDTSLESLNIACGQLVPEFAPDVYEYTVYVTAEQKEKSCAVDAVAKDTEAQIAVTGPESFDKEDVTRTVTVSGGDSETSYTIKVHLVGPTELLLDGVFYTVSDTPDLSELPEKFISGKLEIFGEELSVAQSGDGQLVLVQFISQQEGKKPLWYRYDNKAEELVPVKIVEYDGTKYVQIAKGKDLLYGVQDGQGCYYAYDQKTGEWLYQTGGCKALPLQREKKTVPPLIWVGTIVAVVWALAATAVVWYISRKYKKNEAKAAEQSYFYPRFKAVDEENTEASSEDRLK